MFIAFAIFILAMIYCLIFSKPMLLALGIGFLCFFFLARKRGYNRKEILSMAIGGAKDSLVVIEVLLLIGLVTSFWRSSGTITFFVYHGIQLISPHLFLLIAFLLSCLLSYALGTSFGVAGTVGVIFMVLARSGNVDPIITAGVIMSGVYFGDRGSPASSSANLVAAVTHTNLYDNVKKMMKSSLLPLGISTVVYGFFSYSHPIKHINQEILSSLEKNFDLSIVVLLPAILLLVLPLFRINVMLCMLASILASFCLTIFLQGGEVFLTLKQGFLGYTPSDLLLQPILGGGGIYSMTEVCGIVLLSCAYSGIFNKTNILSGVEASLSKIMGKIGEFPTMIMISIATNGIFCNQTISSIMCSDLLKKPYKDRGNSKTDLAIDIENSAIVIAGIIPWSIACTVPLGMLGVGIEAIPYCLYLYLVPLTYLVTKKYIVNKGEKNG